MKHKSSFKTIAIGSISIWLYVFALVPLVLIFISSFISNQKGHPIHLPFTLMNYQFLFQKLYIRVFEKSFVLAAFSTLTCLLIAYPFAFIITRAKPVFKNFLMLLVIIPFWTSSLIRSYAMLAILKTHGLLNTLLLKLGIIHTPLHILFTNTAVIIGLVYNLLPFMILPLFANMERLDISLIDAARDLGANNFTIFRKVLIPLTKPGIFAGSILVFLPAMTLFYIPDILGGAKSLLLGNLIQDQFLISGNWPTGTALSVALSFLMFIMLLSFRRANKGQEQLLL